ncbi:hypothetical protein VTO42DRAFT_3946 [Malbranchea cinnamomea]
MNSIVTLQRKVLASKNDWDDWLNEPEELEEPTYPEASNINSDTHDITDFSLLQLNIYNVLVK